MKHQPNPIQFQFQFNPIRKALFCRGEERFLARSDQTRQRETKERRGGEKDGGSLFIAVRAKRTVSLIFQLRFLLDARILVVTGREEEDDDDDDVGVLHPAGSE